jgi:hypothetical protein
VTGHRFPAGGAANAASCFSCRSAYGPSRPSTKIRPDRRAGLVDHAVIVLGRLSANSGDFNLASDSGPAGTLFQARSDAVEFAAGSRGRTSQPRRLPEW